MLFALCIAVTLQPVSVMAEPSPQARWGILSEGDEIPTDWISSGNLIDAVSAANSSPNSTVYIQLLSDVSTTELTLTTNNATLLVTSSYVAAVRTILALALATHMYFFATAGTVRRVWHNGFRMLIPPFHSASIGAEAPCSPLAYINRFSALFADDGDFLRLTVRFAPAAIGLHSVF